ncbi:ZIP family metal transporter [Paenibacillus flagellatus]|uniref:ZIP family metal transporter n=1 Tax=Paenibacillus flagellatus TaxID=2211139 RepID=A0A2V5KBI6_9BACL|nr:ZIP family metal transporter [Paenibacillus flagellatus]PYI55484.1 ZIP family metal transporter [Paenibacillus flagellatus]
METMLIGSVLSALSTGFGALPILIFKRVSHRWRDWLIAFTAGVMVSASMFGLIPQALDVSDTIVVSLGVLLGVVVLSLLETYIPHIDLESRPGGATSDKAFLIVAALFLHNIPEGLSVGVSFASVDQELGAVVAIGIGLQNMPEGLLVALFLANQSIGRMKAFWIATLTGSVEIVVAIVGYGLTNYVSGLVPYGLSFAAGAMMFIVYKELIPESHGDGNARTATFSFIFGLLSMIVLMDLFG